MKKRTLSLLLAVVMCLGLLGPVSAAETGDAAGGVTRDTLLTEGEPVVAFTAAAATRQTQNFNYDWKFHLGDVSGAQKKEFDDKDWRSLSLPHDYSIEQDFTPNGGTDSGTGYLPGGTGWYRKSFILPASMDGKRISLNFGGVYMDSTTYVNGTMVGNYPYGYTPFAYDITKLLVCDGVTENVVAVQTKNQLPTSRWYSGSGIYRNVDLVVTDPVHVERYGTFVTTPNLKTEYGKGQAVVNIKTKVGNDGAAPAEAIVTSTILDAEGNVFAQKATTQAKPVAKGAVTEFEQTITTPKPKLWGVKTPTLYTLVTEVEVDGFVVDHYETTFGFRWTTFDPNEGFFLNDEYMKLNGVCMHHDQGALGSVANERAIERQMEIMIDMGVNSIRVCHNPAADELIEICNRLGLLVIDEAFDCWEQGKRANDYGRFFTKPATHPDATPGQTWAEFDIKTMVDRGKNDPCIIMWSIGNEILGPSGGTARNLNKWVKEVDPTRETFQGFNNFIDGSPGKWDVIEASDLLGFNYGEKNATYDKTHAETYPDMPIIGSETSSALRTRGYYANDTTKHIFTNYDTEKVGWGSTMEKAWQRNRDRKWLMGEYMWTGFDYIGEPSPYNNAWPSKSSYFGAVDTAGIPKDAFYMYQSVWTGVEENPMVHLMPHWNWGGDAGYDIKDKDGKIKVQAYTNAPAVELFFNADAQSEALGTSLEKQTFDQLTTTDGRPYQEKNGHIYLEWMVPYAPGKLTAVAYNTEGAEIARDVIKTSGAPAQVRLTPDREIITADGLDLSYILVEVLDKDGNLVPTAGNLVNFQVSGNGFIAGVDNGSQTAVDERYKDNKRKAFSGKAMLIIQSTTEAGPISITATSAGLASDKTTIFTNADQSGDAVLLGYEALPDVKTALNTRPELPETISAVYSDGSRSPMDVTWATITDDQLSALGQFTLKGTVDETEDKVAVTVIVVGALGLQTVNMVTGVGVVPTLPETVVAVYNTGETRELAVTWERELTADDVKAAGTVELEGTVAGFTEKAKVIVRVKEGTYAYKTDIAKREGTYPIPTASHEQANGNDKATAINNGVVNYTGGDRVTGRWIPWGHNMQTEWCQLEFEATHTIGKVGIDFWNHGSDDKMDLPDTITVQYSSDGSTWTNVQNQQGPSKAELKQGAENIFTFDAVTTKWVRWQFDNLAKKAPGITEVHVYEQSVEIPVETGAKLSDIKVNGVTIESFASDVSSYVYPLDFGAAVPVVTATAQGNATYFITPALDNKKATTIFVSSEDGKHTSYYTVQFQEAAPVLETVEISLGGTELVEDDVLPITLTATMQDGTVLSSGVIDVVYTVGDDTVAKVKDGTFYAYRAGSTTLKAAVTYQGVTVQSEILKLTIAPNVAGKTITGYEQTTVTTEKGVAPQLPREVTATFDIGLPKTVAVKWDRISAEKYADYGAFTVKGTVEGQPLRPTATVLVKGIVGVQQFSTATPVGFPPILPTKAKAYFSDGTFDELPVTWEPCENGDFAEDGATVTLTGTVGDDSRGTATPLATTMTVRVSGDTTVPVEPFTMYKNGYYLPLPFASFTNSYNPVDKIYDGKTTSNTTSNDPGQNCWNNWANAARPGDFVGIVFGFEEVTYRTVDNLNIYFYSDKGIEAPESCEIQYYTGDPFVRNDVGQYPIDNLDPGNLLANDENWTPVNILTEPDTLTAHANNKFTFDAIQTCAIRVKMTAQSDKSLGIIEMQAWDKLVDDVSALTALTDIKLNGTSLEGFAPETTEYTYTVEGTDLPVITATAGENNESVTVVTANTAKIIVTAEDGVATKTYTITLERPDLPPEGSKTYAELQELIREAEDLLEDDIYTSASHDTLQAAVDAAKELTEDAALSETTSQYNALQSAINGLVLAPGKKIVAFTLPGQYGRTVIDEAKGTIAITVSQGTDITALVPTIEVSEGATVDPAGGVEQDFTKSVEYTVTASDGATRIYTVTVTVYVPPYTPPSGGGSNTVTEKNPDGSTTKTVTDKKTGNVTETTTYPDGTKIVATTPKDGKTSIEVTVPKGKDSVTVTIPTAKEPAPGEVAVIVHEDGTREIIKTSVATKDGLRITLEGNAKLEIIDNSKSFADVPADHWGADAIAFATSRELFNGGSDGFVPAGDMSRAMLFTVLARLDGQDTTGGESWYSAAMDWAKEAGISDGTNPDASITRESLAVMLYRYAGSPEVGGMAMGEFEDAADVSIWASDAMLWCVESGILNGSGGKLSPASTASRAEVAAMLQRFITAR